MTLVLLAQSVLSKLFKPNQTLVLPLLHMIYFVLYLTQGYVYFLKGVRQESGLAFVVLLSRLFYIYYGYCSYSFIFYMSY
jgi:hypothetical protein